MRCCRPIEQNRTERIDEHRRDIPRSDGRCDGDGRSFPQWPDAGNPYLGCDGFLYRYRKRCIAGQGDEPLRQRRSQNQSAYRCSRRIGCSDGGACRSNGRSERKSEQFPANARYGPKRGRCRRFGRCSRYSAFVPRITSVHPTLKGRSKTDALTFFKRSAYLRKK